MWDVTKCTFKTTANKSSRQEKGGSFLVWFSDWLKSSVGRGTWLGHSHHASPRGQLETAGKQPNILINNKQSPVYSNWFATVAQSSKKDFFYVMLAAPTSGVATTVPAPGVAGYSRGGGGSLGPTLGQRTGSNTSPSCTPPVTNSRTHIPLRTFSPRNAFADSCRLWGLTDGESRAKKKQFSFLLKIWPLTLT